MSQAYYSSSEENIIIGREPVTSLSEAVPAHVMDLVWELDLNALLEQSGIVAPSQVDTDEKIHKKDGLFFLYKVGTDNNTVDTVDEIKVSKVTTTTPANVALTYNGLKADATAEEVKVEGSTEELAMVELAKRLKVVVIAGQPNKVVIVPATENTYSTISVVKIANYALASENPLDSPAQLLSINRFMASLKSKTSNNSWYVLRDALNDESMGTQVKRGLSNLFDKERKLNNLLGSAADSSVFLDLKKIEDKMQAPLDHFYTRIFSVRQLQEVLDAVYDKNDRVDNNNLYRFQNGDSITAVIRVTDGDTNPSTMGSDGKIGNSDRWLITLKQNGTAQQIQLPPTLVSRVPATDSSGHAVHSNISLTFSRPVAAGSNVSISIKKFGDDTHVETINAVSIVDKTVSIDPTEHLLPGVKYYVTVSGDSIKDADNNLHHAGFTDKNTWFFTTAAGVTPPLDTIPPVITLNGVNPMYIAVGSTYVDPGATSDTGGSTPTASGNVNTSSPASYAITYSSTDGSGNTATSTRTVNVVALPVITLNNTTENTHIAINSSWISPATVDDSANMTNNAIDTSTIGLKSITYTAVNKNNSEISATETLDVTVHALPDIQFTGSSTVEYKGSMDFTLNYTLDSLSEIVMINITNYSSFILGEQPVTYIARLIAYPHITTSKVRTVTVQDTVPPIITLNGVNPMYIGLGSTYVEPGATANTGASTPTVSGSVNTNVVDVYNINYSSTDEAGNVGTAIRTVNVVARPTATLNPLNNATEVVTSSDLKLVFNRSMVMEGTPVINIKKVSDGADVGALDVNLVNNTLTINPLVNLAGLTEYYVEISATSLKDTNGVFYAGIIGNAAWRFTTTHSKAQVFTEARRQYDPVYPGAWLQSGQVWQTNIAGTYFITYLSSGWFYARVTFGSELINYFNSATVSNSYGNPPDPTMTSTYTMTEMF